jgi:hypothetical protein
MLLKRLNSWSQCYLGSWACRTSCSSFSTASNRSCKAVSCCGHDPQDPVSSGSYQYDDWMTIGSCKTENGQHVCASCSDRQVSRLIDPLRQLAVLLTFGMTKMPSVLVGCLSNASSVSYPFVSSPNTCSLQHCHMTHGFRPSYRTLAGGCTCCQQSDQQSSHRVVHVQVWRGPQRDAEGGAAAVWVIPPGLQPCQCRPVRNFNDSMLPTSFSHSAPPVQCTACHSHVNIAHHRQDPPFGVLGVLPHLQGYLSG